MTAINEGTALRNGTGAQAEQKAHPAMRLLEPFTAERAIDLTAFMGQWPTRLSIRADAADLSAMADRFGLEGLCVSHIASLFGFDTRSGNEELFRGTAADARLWPFAILNPAEPGWERELDWAAREGARGVRLAPGYHRYSLLSPQAAELVAALGEYRLPLHLAVRLEDERLVHPRFPVGTVPFHEVAELLRLTGDLPVVLSGLRAREWKDVAELLNDGHRPERLLLDLWFTNGPIGAIASLCRDGMIDRLAYGSCAPIQVPEATMIQLAAADIASGQRAALCRGNAARLLGIEP